MWVQYQYMYLLRLLRFGVKQWLIGSRHESCIDVDNDDCDSCCDIKPHDKTGKDPLYYS